MVSEEARDSECTHEPAWGRHEDCRLWASAVFKTLLQVPPGQPALPRPLFISHGISARESKPASAQSRCLTWALLVSLLLQGTGKNPKKLESLIQNSRGLGTVRSQLA